MVVDVRYYWQLKCAKLLFLLWTLVDLSVLHWLLVARIPFKFDFARKTCCKAIRVKSRSFPIQRSFSAKYRFLQKEKKSNACYFPHAHIHFFCCFHIQYLLCITQPYSVNIETDSSVCRQLDCMFIDEIICECVGRSHINIFLECKALVKRTKEKRIHISVCFTHSAYVVYVCLWKPEHSWRIISIK